MTVDDIRDVHDRDLVGFAATLTDDASLAQQLISQALLQTAHDARPADLAQAVRVWIVRGLLSDGYELGAPVAPDVDTPLAAGSDKDDLTARFARSSRLQRAVVALHYGEHCDAAAIARVVGSTERDIDTYLAAVRARLDIGFDIGTDTDGAQALRRLIRDRYTAAAERSAAAQQAEQVRSAAALEAAHRSASDRAAELSADLVELRARHDQVEAELAATRADVVAARADAEAHAAQFREELRAARAEFEQQRRHVLADLRDERAAAAQRESAYTAQLEILQAAVAEQAEQARLTVEAHRADTARADELVAELHRRLELAETEAAAAAASVEVAPVEVAPVEVAPVEVAPVEVAPVEVAPVEVADVAVAPVEDGLVEIEEIGTESVDNDADVEVIEVGQVDVADALVEPAAALAVVADVAPVEVTEVTEVTEVLDAEPQLRPEVLAARASIGDEVDAMFRLSVRKPPPYPSLKVVRPLIALTVVLGLNYLIWRWIFSINWSAWWIAVPLVIGETYSLVDSMIFGFTMWRLKRRPDPGPPPQDATVDVFITTYNEPLDLVMKTARAAQRLTFPHTLWILDDGNRPELRELADAEGIGVISRSSDWVDMPRHAKAGNLNNALMVTQGEFILILDADQVPAPELLDRTLGYFREDRMAVVQTPQFFVNVPKSDPLGSQAPLFYGPIQQGKDGWNSAFFCGSNAVLRREALLQMGIRRYVHELQIRIDDALSTSEKVIRRARAKLPAGQPAVHEALTSVLDAARDTRAELADNASIADATSRFQRRVHEAARRVVEQDLAESKADLNALFELVDSEIAEIEETDQVELREEALDRLARRDWSPLGAIETVAALIAVVDVDREDEAQPIMPMSTISVTEDMATCMRMHSMGWQSAYHDEVLAVGLAPEDLGTMLTQRLRWAQGTIQVMLRENPLRQKGLSFAQRVMYLGTMWSYLSGFAALAYIAAPVIYLVFGVLPVHALSLQFFARLIPFLIVNQLLFFVIGRGRSTWRGQQYSLALFPVWIKAVTSAVSNVAFGRSLTFAVTPKERVTVQKLPWRLVRPQLIAMGLLVFAATIGVLRLVAGQATTLGTTINLVWVAFDLVLFSAVIRALFYRGFDAEKHAPKPTSTPEPHPAATLQESTR